jgi:uncharacterized protein YbjT (DUF2867 family)
MIYSQICLAGSTGLVGSQVLQKLIALNEVKQVQVLSRRHLHFTSPKVKNLVCDFDSLPQIQADAFICCLGTTLKTAGDKESFQKVDYEYVLNFAKIAEQANAKCLQIISALGADINSRIFYNSVKGKMEKEVSKLNIPLIEFFRPSLLLGERKEFRPAEIMSGSLMTLLNPILWGSMKKYRSIQSADVAQAMINSLSFEKTGVHFYESDLIQSLAN